MTKPKNYLVRRRDIALGMPTFILGFSHSARSGANQPTKNIRRTDLVHAHSTWPDLPPTPALPTPTMSGLANINGTRNFYALFGKGPPVLFLHGGLANSNYWGLQVKAISECFTAIVMDTRGHGRSPLISPDFSYRTFAGDVIGLLNFLGIRRTSIVGWSDGAITGIDLAINNPEILNGVFAFGANSNVNGVKDGGSKNLVFSKFLDRARKEYQSLSPLPNEWPYLVSGLRRMWKSQPAFTTEQLSGIRVPMTVSDGQYDEIIKREDTERLAHEIPSAKFLLQSGVSHFSMIQEPDSFNDNILEFLNVINRQT